jgi:predicted ATPase/DNA-binding CsgD family transcriptional regulator
VVATVLTFLAADDEPVVHEAVAAHAGRSAVGDGCVVAAFDAVDAAVAAALAIGRCAPGARVALHADAGRCIRLRDVANDGQMLVAAALVQDGLMPARSLLDLGVHRLRDLAPGERVFELRRAGDDAGPRPLRSLDPSRTNLPVQLTSFVGRRVELAAVAELLPRARLVTLTGAGGSGKTRLALQVAADQAGRFADGVWWVELADVTDPALVAEAVAAATGALAAPGRSLTTQLAARRLLVCLDNCEHVLDGAADVAEALLRDCPEVSILATSREPLGAGAETIWRVPTLAGDDALALFAERAAQVRPGFELDQPTTAVVRALCARLDGIPLALELAAAWLGTLTPAQIEAGLDDRFALLVRGRRGAAPRQQTLAASIDWGHGMLDEGDRVAFRRLAVFAAGFDLDAARAVCDGDDALGALGRLVDKSMVIAEDHDGRARFRLLETMRQYALERLREAGEVDDARDRHLDHFLFVVEDMAPERDRDKDAWRERLLVDYDNLRAAVRWGLAAQDPERGRRLAAGLPWLWHLTGHGRDGLDVIRQAIARAPDDRSLVQARLLCGAALVADTAGPLDVGFDPAQAALDLAREHGDARLEALCLALIAVRELAADFDRASEAGAAAERAGRAAGDGFVVDATRALRGMVLQLRDDHAAAQETLAEAVDGLLARGDRGVAATAVGFQATSALCTGDLAAARELAQRAVAIAAPLADYHRVGTSRAVLALVLGTRGELDAALATMEPVLRLVEGAEGAVFVPGLARTMGTLHLWRGDADEALRWLEPAADPLAPLPEALALAGRSEEADAPAARAEEVARAHGMPRALADALEQQGFLAATDDPERAIDLHHQALAIRVEHGLRTFYPDSLDALAALAGYVGRTEHAARALAASDRARAELGYPRRPTLQTLVADVVPDPGEALALDDAVSHVRRTRGARARPPGGWASLTPTELEVVRLAVEGLNNPEIGARLFMSRSTVKTHLSHVYAKLGVANRTELAKLAAAHLS